MELNFLIVFSLIVLFALHSEGSTCTYTDKSDSTVFGGNMDGSGEAFSSASGCLNLCCNTANCAAAAWVSSWGGCYLKSSSTLNSSPVTYESGTHLLIVTGSEHSSSCKRGVGYGGWLSIADFDVLMSGLTWYYEWDPSPDSVSAAAKGSVDAEFVPMIWGQGHIPAMSTIPSGSRYLLGFNEPNFIGQSNLTPQQAAALWPQLQTYADANNLKLVSPSLNFCGGACNVADPIQWLTQFFQACVNCRVDYIGMHTYTCEVQYLQQHVGLYKVFNKPIWVTEFACGDGNPSLSEQEAYMKDALAYLDSDPDVFRYAWFSGRTTSVPNAGLLAGNGKLTSLGQLYVSGYSCKASSSSAISESEANSNPTITPVAGIIAAVFVIFVIVIPLVVVGAYFCYKNIHKISEVA